jgi:hypothetical protein
MGSYEVWDCIPLFQYSIIPQGFYGKSHLYRQSKGGSGENDNGSQSFRFHRGRREKSSPH